ncbi:DUF4194 domain-containing protein [Tepidicaulis sp. LMO-SS28]|uniref:DUF4194 domain-containing protein n=1 Tax=Tepidicaulis sp. LMO-SS28 TaxID=3447455 RepID=UPI003EE3F381
MIVSRWASQEAGKDPNTTAEELTETANRLLHRQFIARGDLGGTAHFERVQRHLDYFQDLFASLGFRLVFNDGWGYVGFVSPQAYGNARVPTQETILLLCLRLLYSEGAQKGYFVDGSADILVDEEEVQTVYSSFGARRLKPGELREILTQFKRRGLVGFDQSHSLNVDVEVSLRPTLLEVVDESFLSRIAAWREGSSSQSEPPDTDGERPSTTAKFDAGTEAASTRLG